MPRAEITQKRPSVGVSSCLLGEEVRYDGGHKHDAGVAALSQAVEFVRVCPEVEIGLGVPRPKIHLARLAGQVRLLQADTPLAEAADHTAAMQEFAAARLSALAAQNLSGYVFKARSPSCGLRNVPVATAGEDETPLAARGMFAAALIEHLPDLPRAEEGDLQSAEGREAFLGQVLAYDRLEDLFRGWQPADLVAQHAREKLLLMAQQPETYQELGQLVAAAGSQPQDEFTACYRRTFMQAMREPFAPPRHVNALKHAAGSLRARANEAEREALRAAIESFADGKCKLPQLLVHVRMLSEKYAIDWLCGQTYLTDHPALVLAETHAEEGADA